MCIESPGDFVQLSIVFSWVQWNLGAFMACWNKYTQMIFLKSKHIFCLHTLPIFEPEEKRFKIYMKYEGGFFVLMLDFI